MQNWLDKYSKYLVIGIVFLASFLVFFNLTRADIQHDDAAYAIRGVGYFDYLDNDYNQTTPFNWFDKMPWWSKLSFHDHPPLVFLIQNLFFKIFGMTTFAAKLPFALAGVLSVFLLYLTAKKLFGVNIGLLASFILAISSYHSWASRIGYLEAISLFFILLTIYLFFVALKNNKFFILFGISLGLAFLTKYTTFFLIPLFFIYLFIKDRKIFGSKYFIFGIIISVLVFSPVIIYNLKLYQTRGHFDLQISGLLKQDISGDWPNMSNSKVDLAGILGNSFTIWQNVFLAYSLPLCLLLIISFGFLIFHWKRENNLFILLALFLLTLQFSAAGNAFRFISFFNPFIAAACAIGLIHLYNFLNRKFSFDSFKKISFWSVIALIFIFEIFYNLNTNSLINPIGEKGKHYSVIRWNNTGYNQLEKYLIEEFDLDNRKILNIAGKENLYIDLSKQENIVVFDPNLNWFSNLWYFRRWALYQNSVLVSAADLDKAIAVSQWFDVFKLEGVKNLYYIYSVEETARDIGSVNSHNLESAANLAKAFELMKAEISKIYNLNNQLIFKVYKLKLN